MTFVDANNQEFSTFSALVVDDAKTTRTIVSRMLLNLGFRQILQAEDGAVALQLVEAHRPSIVICDINMTPIDGLVFLRTLRKDPALFQHDIPVIFLTNQADSETVNTARALGVDSFILKPVSPATLRDRLNFSLARRLGYQ